MLTIRRRTAVWAGLVVATLLATVMVMILGVAADAAAPYFNGFEDPGDVGGPDDHVLHLVDRVASGTNGVPSADGGFHAEAPLTDYPHADGFVFTRYDGYSDVFPGLGYRAEVDVYLDLARSGSGEDLRFDWSSAVNKPDGSHQRDFIFHVGTDGAGGYLASVSNNAPGDPSANDPLAIAETGWYTLRHDFFADADGVLNVFMSVLDDDGNILKTWVRSDASDEIGVTVGGNRYGWLVTNEFDDLALDNIRLENLASCVVDASGNGHYENIEPAIENDLCEVIEVRDGTYAEGPQVVIDRDVTIIGAGSENTTKVVPTADTGSSGDSRGWFLIESGEVDISDMRFDGDGFDIFQAFRHKGTGSFDDVVFENITFPTYSGVAIAAFGGVGPVDVFDSTFQNIGRVGVLYFGVGSGGEFTGNTYTGKGVGDWLDYALDISAGALVEVSDNTVTMNRGVASSDGSISAGFLVTTFFGGGTTATFDGNTIEDNTHGVHVGFDGTDASTAMMDHNEFGGNDVAIHVVGDDARDLSSANRNAIEGNGDGVVVATPLAAAAVVLGYEESSPVSPAPSAATAATDVPFDATCNWWGDAGGPSGDGTGAGDSVSSDATFLPWLETSDLDGECIGGIPKCDELPATIEGTDGDDVIVGTAGDDVIVGFGGDDDIDGLGGDDLICGGPGDDTIRGGPGDDVLDGEAGDDVLDGGDGDDVANGGDGDDDIVGGAGDDLLVGGPGDDLLAGEVGDDQLIGGLGDDQLDGGGGDDIIDGDDGADVLDGGDGDDSLEGGEGDDLLFGGDGADVADGGDGDDFIATQGGDDLALGGGGDDVIRGGSGDDTLFGDAGEDTVFGGSGFDTIRGGADDDVLRGGDGDDSVFGDDGDDTVLGGPGDDLLRGDVGDDALKGGTGDDTIHGSVGNDVARGNPGEDTLLGGAGDDRLSGGLGSDVVRGHGGDDALRGNADDDRVFGGAGDDHLFGGGGDDRLEGNGGSDSARGGPDFDLCNAEVEKGCEA